MARKPSYDFERRERERAKAVKKEEPTKGKAEGKIKTVAPDAPSALQPRDHR